MSSSFPDLPGVFSVLPTAVHTGDTLAAVSTDEAALLREGIDALDAGDHAGVLRIYGALEDAHSRPALAAGLELSKHALRAGLGTPAWLVTRTVRLLIALGRPLDAHVLLAEAKREGATPADLADLADLEEAHQAWSAARTRAHDAHALTLAFQKRGNDAETFADIINRGTRWLRALEGAGYGLLVETAFGNLDAAISRVHERITPSDVEAMEQALGFALPPSYARFLTEVGGVAVLGDEGLTSVAPSALVASSAEVSLPDEPRSHHPQGAEVLHVANAPEGRWVLLGAYRDQAGEAPAFLVADGAAELERGLSHDTLLRVCAGDVRVRGAIRPRPWQRDAGLGDASEDENDAVAPALSDALADESLSQRDKVRLIESEWLARVASAGDDEALAVLHLVRGAIKSKKLREARDTLLAEIRRDGLPGDAPLPSLPKELRAATARKPKAEAPRFETFQRWLSDRLEDAMRRVVDELETHLPRMS